MIFAGKKVLVFGTGKSGIAAEDLLHKKGASVVLYDGNDKLEKEEILKKLESRDSVEVVLGELRIYSAGSGFLHETAMRQRQPLHHFPGAHSWPVRILLRLLI